MVFVLLNSFNFFLRGIVDKHIKLLTGLLLLLLSIQTIFLLITFFKWGPIISSDTLSYFASANTILKGNYPYSPLYSPGYPYLIAFISMVLGISLEKASYVSALLFFISACFVLYKIIRALSGLDNKTLAVCVALLIVNFWWSIKIIYFAHADSMFFIFHLLVLHFLIKFFQTEKMWWFLLSALIAASAIWIKYNALIYFPYLAIAPLIFYGWKSKAIIGILPAIFIGFSFLMFKTINGQIIYYFETAEKSFWWGDVKTQVLLTNLADIGRILAGTLVTDLISLKLPMSLSVIITIGLITAVAVSTFQRFGKSSLSTLLLLFVAGYFLAFGLLAQFNNVTEMDSRTLFVPVVTLLLFFYKKTMEYKSIYITLFVVVFLILQPVRTFAGLVDWYRHAPMDSFSLAAEFMNKPSVKRLETIMKERNLNPGNVYTDYSRYMTIYFNYQWVNRVKTDIAFNKGKMLPVSEGELIKQCKMLIKNLNTGHAILILFNAKPEVFACFENEIGLTKEEIDNVLIFYR